jgi:hypothetical protein
MPKEVAYIAPLLHVLSSATAYSTTQGSGTAQDTSFCVVNDRFQKEVRGKGAERREGAKETTQLQSSGAYWIQNLRLGGSR